MKNLSNYLLYEDENQKIEIAGWFHSLVDKIGIKQFRINKTDFEPILYEIFTSMKKRNAPIIHASIAPNVPIIEHNKFLALNEPYDFFTEPLCLIATYNNILENKDEIIEGVEQLSTPSLKFYCDIFPKSIYGVSGYIVAKQKDNDSIFLFGYKTNLQEEDNQ